jgi:alkanesulfonate monooxygenase SsuD/methylene tetrahydromethanopterin reductase-like flavin-dependent oxidoreductase (luciferase family)
MFGGEQDGHDDRYARGQEWLEVLLRLWSEEVPFDYDGRYYRLKGVAGRPRPWGGRRPILMNAGNSVAGRVFGALLRLGVRPAALGRVCKPRCYNHKRVAAINHIAR